MKSILEESVFFACPVGLREANTLERAGIRTVGDLIAGPEVRLCYIRGIGKKTLRQLREGLAELGLAYPKPPPAERTTPPLRVAPPSPPPPPELSWPVALSIVRGIAEHLGITVAELAARPWLATRGHPGRQEAASDGT